MTYLIVGGSSGLGRALAEKFAAEGCELVLISQDGRDTRALASHLRLTHDVEVTALELDLTQAELPFDRIDRALSEHAPLKGMLLPAGLNDADDSVGLDDLTLEKIARANYLSPVKLINRYLPEIERNGGSLVGFGSVATARGRTRNAAYAAAKRALESYFDSLMHFGANTALAVQFYVPGYLDTNLAFAEKLLFPLGDPAQLAHLVHARLRDQGRKTFFPGYWRLIYRIVQFLPWGLFKRLSF